MHGALAQAVTSTRIVVRGTVLGKTPRSIDVEIGTGISRVARRLEFAPDVPIYASDATRLDRTRAGDVVALACARPGTCATGRALLVFSVDFDARSRAAFAARLRDAIDVRFVALHTARRIARGAGVPAVRISRGADVDLTSSHKVAIVADDASPYAEAVARAVLVARARLMPPLPLGR